MSKVRRANLKLFGEAEHRPKSSMQLGRPGTRRVKWDSPPPANSLFSLWANGNKVIVTMTSAGDGAWCRRLKMTEIGRSVLTM